MNPETAPIQHFGDMPTEEFRQHGHALVDWIAAYRQNLDNIKVLPDVQPGSVAAQLPKSAPEAPEAMTALLGDFERLILPNLTQWHHPNFFAYFANSASLPAVLAEFLTAAINNNSMVWKSGQAATELEHVTLDWLRQALALPPAMWGMIFDTASISTMQAIACAREEAGVDAREKGLAGRTTPRLRVYASEFVHSSIDKACITLGLGAENLVKIPANERFQMIPEALEKAIADDRQAGHLPICVVGVVGTTSVASSDPITTIAAICKREKLWLHVDAAYAGPVAMLPEWRGRFAGWEEADSIVINPHKWLLVPMDLSILYTRKPHVLKQAFSLTPEYLKTTEDALVENMMDYGIQLGRRFRSLKLWFVMRYFGIEGLQARLREHIALARLFGDLVEAHPDFELTAPVEFSLVCFRFRPQNLPNADEATRERLLERFNTELEEWLNASGDIFLVHTKVHGVYTLRFAVGNMETTEKHVRRAFERIADAARMLGQ